MFQRARSGLSWKSVTNYTIFKVWNVSQKNKSSQINQNIKLAENSSCGLPHRSQGEVIKNIQIIILPCKIAELWFSRSVAELARYYNVAEFIPLFPFILLR